MSRYTVFLLILLSSLPPPAEADFIAELFKALEDTVCRMDVFFYVSKELLDRSDNVIKDCKVKTAKEQLAMIDAMNIALTAVLDGKPLPDSALTDDLKACIAAGFTETAESLRGVKENTKMCSYDRTQWDWIVAPIIKDFEDVGKILKGLPVQGNEGIAGWRSSGGVSECVNLRDCTRDDECGDSNGFCVGALLAGQCDCAQLRMNVPCDIDDHCGGLRTSCQEGRCEVLPAISRLGHTWASLCQRRRHQCHGLPRTTGKCACR